jgi:hypothetical protein
MEGWTRAMEMRKKRIAVAVGSRTLEWLHGVQDEIRLMTGREPPGEATLLSDLIEALRRDDEAAHGIGITVTEACH